MQWLEGLRTALPGVVAALPYACYGFLALMILAGIARLSLLARSTVALKQHVRSLRSVDYRRFQDSEHVMPVSLILPAVNVTDSLKEQVENLLGLDFKQYELIVVANSAHTEAWQSLMEGYRLLPFHQPFKKTLPAPRVDAVYRSASDVRLVVLDVKDASRAGALNAGVNVSSYPIVAPVYPDVRLTKDALLKMVYAFVSDSACVFIGSFPRIGTGQETEAKLHILAQQQYLERLRTLYTGRRGYATYGMYLTLNNSFAAYLKNAVTESGGFSADARAENTDLLLRIHARLRKEKRAYCARLLPDAVAYQVPQKRMNGVCRQQRSGLKDLRNTVRRNHAIARALRGAGYTRLSERGGPLLEVLGIIVVLISAVLGAVPLAFAGLYLLLGILIGAVQSVLAMLLEEYAFQQQTDTGLLLGRYVLAILLQIGFRLRTTLARVFS